MGKKKKAILDKEFAPFEAGMKANGYTGSAIKTLWDILVPFSDYAFNKAHSAAYGLVSYWTAYLKANYPAEDMAALLTSVADDKDKSALYLNECRRMGIKVLPPDVNESVATFAPVGKDIRFGLAAIRNVGGNVVEAISAADEAEPRPRAGDRSDAQIVKIGGILSGVQRKVTKQGNQWAAATLEDLGGAIEVLFFPQTYQLYATSIAEDAVVVVKGKVDRRDDVPQLIAMDLTIPDLSVDDSGPFVVSMPVARCVPPAVGRLREGLVAPPGPTPVH